MMAARVQVNFTLDGALYAQIEKRAAAMNLRAAEYARRLLEAAYAARIGAEKGLPLSDVDLDRAVRAVFCLSGEFDAATISRVTGVPVSLVEKTLRGFRMTAREISARKTAPLAVREEEQAPCDKTVRVNPKTQLRSGFTPQQQRLIAELWADGVGAAQIGQEVDADGDTIRQFAKAHRDLCEARDPKTAASLAAASSAKRYSPEEIETIRRLWAADHTAMEIARRLGRSLYSVKTWIKSHREICPKKSDGPPGARGEGMNR